MTDNIFHEPLPRTGIVLQQRVWNATADGKDASRGDLKLTANTEKLWISNVMSIPLTWLVAIEPLGPGLRLTWMNKVTGAEEEASFCIRTFFGYDTIRRDQLLKDLRDLSVRARSAAPSSATTSSADLRCERCGARAAMPIDLRKITNFLVYWIVRTDRRVLCRTHAESAIRANAMRNAITGTVGIPGAFATPFAVWRSAALLSSGQRIALTAAALFPAAALLAFVVWIVTFSQ